MLHAATCQMTPILKLLSVQGLYIYYVNTIIIQLYNCNVAQLHVLQQTIGFKGTAWPTKSYRLYQDVSLPGQGNGLWLLGHDATLLQQVIGDPKIKSIESIGIYDVTSECSPLQLDSRFWSSSFANGETRKSSFDPLPDRLLRILRPWNSARLQ